MAGDEDWLRPLLEDTRDARGYAMLILEPKLAPPRKLVHHPLLPGYFPREFVVLDACEANTSFVWLAKYLPFLAQRLDLDFGSSPAELVDGRRARRVGFVERILGY